MLKKLFIAAAILNSISSNSFAMSHDKLYECLKLTGSKIQEIYYYEFDPSRNILIAVDENDFYLRDIPQKFTSPPYPLKYGNGPTYLFDMSLPFIPQNNHGRYVRLIGHGTSDGRPPLKKSSLGYTALPDTFDRDGVDYEIVHLEDSSRNLTNKEITDIFLNNGNILRRIKISQTFVNRFNDEKTQELLSKYREYKQERRSRNSLNRDEYDNYSKITKQLQKLLNTRFLDERYLSEKLKKEQNVIAHCTRSNLEN